MFKVIAEGCEPKRTPKYAACADVFSAEDVVIGAGETAVVGLGIAIDLEELLSRIIPKNNVPNLRYKDEIDKFMKSHYFELILRSSLGKKGLILSNGVGIIDLDYPNEIKMIIHNPITGFDDEFLPVGALEFSTFTINKGDKIGKIMLMEHKSYFMSSENGYFQEVRKGNNKQKSNTK